MESYLLLIVAIIVSAGSLYIGFRIGRGSGRITGTGGAGRPVNSDPVSGVDKCTESATRLEESVGRAIKTNEQTAEVIQKMRDILNKRDSSSSRNDISAAEKS